jgi:hypothetical protein
VSSVPPPERGSRLKVPPPRCGSLGHAGEAPAGPVGLWRHAGTVVRDPQGGDLGVARQVHLDMAGAGVAGHVGQRLAQGREHLRSQRAIDLAVDRTAEADLRLEAQAAGGFRAHLEDLNPHPLACRPRGFQSKDRGAHLADRFVELGDGLVDAAPHRIVRAERPDRLEGQTGGKQPLDHPVVQVPGDALPVGDQGELAHPGPAGGRGR